MLDRFYNQFLTDIPILLPQLMSPKFMVSHEDLGDYIEVIYHPKTLYPLEEVKEMFVDDTRLHILYERVASAAVTGWQCVCAFPHPTSTKMYKFNALANGDGLVDAIIVRIYADVEIFTSALIMELDLQLRDGNVSRHMNEEDILPLRFL